MFGFLLLSVAVGPALKSTFGAHGAPNDFMSFYTGARLLPKSQLYLYNQTFEFEKQLGLTDPTPMVYIRLPFYALLFTPLAKLDYKLAYAIFQIGSILSFVLAMLLWRRFGAGTCLLLAGWSGAMAIALLRGQDAAYVLLFASVSAALLRKGQHFSAGAILALGMIKWNLLLFFPLMMIAKKMTRFGLGAAAGASVLLALSFLVYPGWPGDYPHALQLSETTLHVAAMPNLRSLLSGVSGALGIQLLGIAAGAVLCWRVFRSAGSGDQAVAISLLAGVIFSTHDYAYDCVLLLPAVGVAASLLNARPVVQACCAAAFSFCPVLLNFERARFIPQIAFIGVFLWVVLAERGLQPAQRYELERE